MIENNGYIAFREKLDSLCKEYTDKNAITYLQNDGSKNHFSFGDIHGAFKRAKTQFTSMGLCPSDRAAVIAPLSPFSFVAVLSLSYSGITGVMIDAALPTEEICRLLEKSDVRMVITIPSIYADLDKSLVKDIPILNLSQTLDHTLFDGAVQTISSQTTADPDPDVIAIMYSSGTTASMKGVMVTYTATLQSVIHICHTAKIDNTSKYLLILPINHIAGFNSGLAFFFAGGEIGMLEAADVSKLQSGFHAYRPTHFVIVPKGYEVMAQKVRQAIREKGAMTARLVFSLLSLFGFIRKRTGLNPGKIVFKNIRHQVFGDSISVLGVGANICNAEVTAFFLNLGIDGWANFYASTETNVPATCTGIFDRYPTGTEGYTKRFEGIEVKICDPDESGIGEIRVKSALMMKGYFREPEITREAFDAQGHFKTGDLGYIDKKGYLHVTGRIKEAILLHTGKKVAPFDVDSLYGGLCPNVAIASCGVPDRDGAFDEIHLFIERNGLDADGQRDLQNAVMGFSAQTSTLYKITKVHFIDKLPMTSVGKVKRYRLKELAMTRKIERAAPVNEKRALKAGDNPFSMVKQIIAALRK